MGSSSRGQVKQKTAGTDIKLKTKRQSTVKDIDEQLDALAERIEIADITNKVLKERIDALSDKIEALQKMVDE